LRGGESLHFNGSTTVQAFTLPTCAIAYATTSTLFESNRDLYAEPWGTFAGYGNPFTLTTDTSTTMATDGPNVYFINAAGELRALPIP
jgi:hypothetical protein